MYDVDGTRARSDSERKIVIPNYWKFPKDTVLRVPSAALVRALGYSWHDAVDGRAILPEDLYLFDVDMTFSLIPTHEHRYEDSPEYQQYGERCCLRAS